MTPRIDPETSGGTLRGQPAPTRGAPPRGHESGSGDPRRRLETVAGLIGDESPTVRDAVRSELRAAGRAGRAWVSRAARSSDARKRAHGRAMSLELEREEIVRRLIRHVAREQVDFESSLFLLGRLERSDLDARPYMKALDAMATRVRLRARTRAPGIERAKALVEYLGEELGYEGDVDAYHHPDNVFLHRTMESKCGLPLTLSALYAFVAARAGLRVGILPLPGHVMVRLYGADRNLVIDPFHGGKIRTQSELMNYLARNGLAFDPGWFRDASGVSLLRRQVLNLAKAWSVSGGRHQARVLVPLISALQRRQGA